MEDHSDFLDSSAGEHDAFLDAPPEEGAGMAFGRGLARNLPLAQQAISAAAPVLNKIGLADKPDYSGEMQHMNDAAEASKAAHGTAYGAGAVTGTVGPLFIPGVGEALEAAPILGNAALGAAQGISDTDVVAHPGQAAGEAVIGGGVGGGVGGIMGALGKYFAGKAAPAVGKAVSGEAAPLAETVAAPAAAHIPGNIIPDQTPVAENFVPSSERIAASNWARGIGFTPRKFMAYAKEMGENPQTAATEGRAWSEEKGLINWMDHPGESLERIGPIKQAAGKAVGDTMEKFGTQPIPAKEIETELLDLAKRTANPSAKGTLVNVADRIDDMATDGVLDWHSLNELKGMVGQEVREHPNLSKAYGLLSQRMNTMAEATGKMIGDPTLNAAYQAAKRDYRMASLLEPAMMYSEAKNLIGGPAGHNTLRGVLGQLTEALTGAPPVGQIIKNAQAKSSPFVQGVGKIGEDVAGAARATGIPQVAGKVITGNNLKRAIPLEATNYAQSELKKALENKYGKKGNQ